MSENSGWTSERSAAGDRNPWILTSVISLATFMTVLDTSIANVALPNIAGNLGVTIRESTWVLTSFLVATAVVVPISGWLNRVIGRKRYYMISVALFTGASLLCAAAPNLGFLVFARILQGVGGGGLAPTEQSILADSFPPEKRGMAFAAYTAVVVVAPILGPTIGGYVTDTFSWHWIFLINLPVGLISLFLVQIFVVEADVLKRERSELLKRGFKVDYIGFLLVVLGLGCLTITLELGNQYDWFASPWIVTSSILAVVALAALVWWETHIPDPIVRLALLANRNFAIIIGIIFLIGIILFGTTQIIPQMFQEIYGYTAFDAGLALTAGGVGIVMMTPFAGRLAGRADPRLVIIPAMLMLTFGLWHFTTLTIDATFSDLALARFLQTFALPFVFVTVNTIAYVGIRQDQTNDASALLNVFRSLGGSVGIAFSQTVLAQQAQVHQSELTGGLNYLNPVFVETLNKLSAVVGGPQAALGMIYREVMHQASFLAYLDVYRYVMIIMLVCIPFCLLLRGGKQVPKMVMVE